MTFGCFERLIDWITDEVCPILCISKLFNLNIENTVGSVNGNIFTQKVERGIGVQRILLQIVEYGRDGVKGRFPNLVLVQGGFPVSKFNKNLPTLFINIESSCHPWSLVDPGNSLFSH